MKKLRNTRLLSEERKLSYYAWNLRSTFADYSNCQQHDVSLEWHFIGPLQSNKTRLVAEYFDWMQTLERAKIADRLNEQRSLYKAPLNVLIQINI